MSDPRIEAYMRGGVALKAFAPEMGPIQRTALVQTVVDAALDTPTEAERLAALEAALRTIQSAIPGYLKQKMTAEDFALIVIGAVDNAMVNKALEKVDERRLGAACQG